MHTDILLLLVVYIVGAITGPFVVVSASLLWSKVYAWWWVRRFCWDWYCLRSREGHPISLWRAFFGDRPRFGMYEYEEEGCPPSDKKLYELVRKLYKKQYRLLISTTWIPAGTVGYVQWTETTGSKQVTGWFICAKDDNHQCAVDMHEVQEIG